MPTMILGGADVLGGGDDPSRIGHRTTLTASERIEGAEEALHEIARDLFNGGGRRREIREEMARKLNALASSLKTARLEIDRDD